MTRYGSPQHTSNNLAIAQAMKMEELGSMNPRSIPCKVRPMLVIAYKMKN